MEETAIEVRAIMCALTQEYVDLQRTYGEVINQLTSTYNIEISERQNLAGDFAMVLCRLLWLTIGANLTFFDAARVKNIIASRTPDVASANSEAMSMELTAAKIHAKTIDDLLVSYDTLTATVMGELRELIITYGTMGRTVEVSETVTNAAEEIVEAVSTYMCCDDLTSATEKCFNETYETLVAEYGEVVVVRWLVAAHFYGNYVSVAATVSKPAVGSIH